MNVKTSSPDPSPTAHASMNIPPRSSFMGQIQQEDSSLQNKFRWPVFSLKTTFETHLPKPTYEFSIVRNGSVKSNIKNENICPETLTGKITTALDQYQSKRSRDFSLAPIIAREVSRTNSLDMGRRASRGLIIWPSHSTNSDDTQDIDEDDENNNNNRAKRPRISKSNSFSTLPSVTQTLSLSRLNSNLNKSVNISENNNNKFPGQKDLQQQQQQQKKEYNTSLNTTICTTTNRNDSFCHDGKKIIGDLQQFGQPSQDFNSARRLSITKILLQQSEVKIVSEDDPISNQNTKIVIKQK